MSVIPGATLGRYTLLKRLASSGNSELILARASGAAGFEHHVVIKRMRAEKGTDPQSISMFLDELRLAGSLHHQNIVQVHDAGREGNDYYYAMEYVHGEDLRKILTRVVKRKELVPLDHVVTIALAITQGLHHAHEQRTPSGIPLELVHRDVSPSNVIVGYDGTVKVVDFGVAKASIRTAQTKAGTLRGKAPYMAPEQCAGRPLDRRADIFALGILLWELVTARRLFKGANDFMTMAAIVAGKVPAPARLREELPADFEKIILKALSPAPEARFQTAQQVSDALEEMATNNIIRISQAALTTYMKQLFGLRPEPWLVEEEETNVEGLDVDFDGSDGVVKITREQVSNLDAVRELVTAHTAEQEAAAAEADDDEFDDQPMTELVDTEVPSQAMTVREIAATIEAARLLRPSAQQHSVTTPLPSDFDVRTAVSDQAEQEQLRRASAQITVPTPVAPAGTPANPMPVARPTPPGSTPPQPRPTPPPSGSRPGGSTSPPPIRPRPTPQPGTMPPPMPAARPTPQPGGSTPPPLASPILSRPNIPPHLQPGAPDDPDDFKTKPRNRRDGDEEEPSPAPLPWPAPVEVEKNRMKWGPIVIICVIAFAGIAVLTDLLLR